MNSVSYWAAKLHGGRRAARTAREPFGIDGRPRTRRPWIAFALAAATAFGCAGLSAPAALADAPGAAKGRLVRLGAENKVGQLRVTTGKSETLRMDVSFTDIVVGDPETADVVPLTDRSIYVLGKKVGTTNVTIYDAQKQVVGVIEVEVSYDGSKLAAELRRSLPGSKIQVSSVNGRIMLTGVVPDSVTLDRAITIARHFAPDCVNGLSIASPQQVMLEVRFIEASRSADRELGVEWRAIGSNVAALTGLGGLATGNVPFGVLIGRLLGNGVQADVIIRGLEEKGLARRLAEPNLVALSGDTASFLAGGEFPFPVAATENRVTIEFKRFGVGLAFTPTVLANGLINLKIEPEVSQLDVTRTVRVSSVEVPSLVVRRASTTVELRDGQSFAVAGLLQSMSSTSQQQLPWLGDVPILGALFRSAAYQKNETDLVIIVTPRLVRPVPPGKSLRTPLDDSRPGNDVDVFLLGKGEVTAEMIRHVEQAGRGPASTGHIIDFPKRDPHGTPR